jgi:3-oxoacyl-[acyl-carrier-protein] synthase-3
MAGNRLDNIRIAGISAAVPQASFGVADGAAIPASDLAKISASTGVMRRHLAAGATCTSDLCHAAASKLLDELNWPKESIEALIFVSQTPDYVMPATACSLHGRLELARSCAAFDVNLGCSGYVYGLWLAGNLLQGGGVRRMLLLAGDTISRIVSPEDRSVAYLFGDAGTATAIEISPGAAPMFFELGTDGSGADHLMVPAGGFRRPRGAATATRSEREGGNVRADEDLFMNGGEIFAFTMAVVPQVCRDVLNRAAWAAETVDGFVMHQANRFMLQHLGRTMRVPKEKLVLALENYGNTSSASIPLAMAEALRDPLQEHSMRLLLAGFGVGFSWAAAALECGPIAVPPIVTLQ